MGLKKYYNTQSNSKNKISGLRASFSRPYWLTELRTKGNFSFIAVFQTECLGCGRCILNYNMFEVGIKIKRKEMLH